MNSYNIIKTYGEDASALYIKNLRKRSSEILKDINEYISPIIDDVINFGDDAVIKYSKKFDKVSLTKESLKVSQDEIEYAHNSVSKDFLKALKASKKNITAFHEKQKKECWFMNGNGGIMMGQKILPLEKAGIYVPGGTAAYPSSVLMNSIPAKCAGVDRIIMATPPGPDGKINPYILSAAYEAGITEIYRAGGVQAIAAMAYGTQTIPKVDKIVGPGNVYVAAAKRMVFGTVDIDMIAGPSEILIIADKSADPAFAASDLLSQAEHDVKASAILITDCSEFAAKVKEELASQVSFLPRKDIILSSLNNFGGIIITKNIKNAVRLCNEIAPEHLEIMTENPFEILGSIRNAGSVFLGSYSPEALGDYMAGPNHVLPTSGTARFFSPLSVDDFTKKFSFTYYSKEALSEVSEDIKMLSEAEGLKAHGNSISVRFR